MGFFFIVVADGFEKIDDAAQEMRAEDADGAEIEQVDAVIGAHLVIAQMWVAVDDTIPVERDVPAMEECAGDVVPGFHWRVFVHHRLQGAAGEPGHGEEAVGGIIHARGWGW